MTMRQFQQHDELIDREAELAAIRQAAYDVVTDRQNRVLYFRAAGGLGKTRLLKETQIIIEQEHPGMLVAPIIDMYDFENRKPIEIERKLVEGLIKAAQAKKVDEQTIIDIFYPYKQAYSYFHNIRGISQQATRQAEDAIHGAFEQSCNKLSELYPLVFRFDTIEAMNTKAPEYSFTNTRPRSKRDYTDIATPKSPIDIKPNFFPEWFTKYYVNIHPCLTLLSGRPHESYQETELTNTIKQLYPDFEPITPSPIKKASEFIKYLHYYDVNVSENRIPYIKKITNGLPLLLTLYAYTYENIYNSQAAFEDSQIELTFNLLNYIPEAPSTGLKQKELEVYIYCLFILSCARRGIQRTDLREALKILHIHPLEEIIDHLDDQTLIRNVPGWSDSTATNEAPEANSNDTLLLLHDEILDLIDKSEKIDELGYRRPILDFLCETSRKQVHELILKSKGPQLKLLSDHMYYELTRDILRGYSTYTIYTDWMLRQRHVQDALIIGDVFWSTMFKQIQRNQEFGSETYANQQNDEMYQPFYEQLIETQQINTKHIEYEEEIRYIKRLRFSDENEEAVAQAAALYQQLADKGVLPEHQDWRKFGDLSQDTVNIYIYAELCLIWASSIARVGTDSQAAITLLTKLISWLESEETKQAPEQITALPFHQQMAYLRRCFFLGEAYNIRGQIRQGDLLYEAAVLDLEASIKAFKTYQSKTADELNDSVAADIAQVENNLAFCLLEHGQFEQAQKLSDALIETYVKPNLVASTYQKALFYNTNALILIGCQQFELAKSSLDQARRAAAQSGVDRAIGLVARATAQYERIRWARKETRDHQEISAAFEEAAAKLPNEPRTRGEIYLDHTRFTRDLMYYYQKENIDPERVRDCWRDAQTLLDKANQEFQRTKISIMHEANLQEIEAGLYILRNPQAADDLAKAGSLLSKAQELLDNTSELPSYAQVVAGKISLQRGLLLLYQGHPQQALEFMAIALARAYLFASNHHDSNAFKKLIRTWVEDGMVERDQLRRFASDLAIGDVAVQADQLPKPIPPSDKWQVAWDQSCRFFRDSVEEKPIEHTTATDQHADGA